MQVTRGRGSSRGSSPLLGISEDRRHDARARPGVPGELPAIDVRPRVEGVGSACGGSLLGNPVRRLADPVVRAEEPETVLEDVPAESEADVPPIDRRLLRRQDVLVRDLDVGPHPARVVVAEDVPVKIIAARARHGVDDAADRVAIFGPVAPGLDLHFLDRLGVEDRSLEGLLDVVGVDAVDQIKILDRGRSVDGEWNGPPLCGSGVRLHSGLQP